MKVKIKNRSHRYDINRPKSRQGHKFSIYNKCLTMILLTCIKQRQTTFEAQFMKKFSNTEAELKKSMELKMKIKKNHTHVKKMGHTSKFLFGIYS